jgi:hypothetical protein
VKRSREFEIMDWRGRPTAFEMVCERPPAAFGGSPPHEGENKVLILQVISFEVDRNRGNRRATQCLTLGYILTALRPTSQSNPKFRIGGAGIV